MQPLYAPVHEARRAGQGTWWVPEDAGTIQEAIDAANPGDTVLIGSGTYNECCIFMKSDITLLGETGEAAGVVIDERAGSCTARISPPARRSRASPSRMAPSIS